MGLVGLFVGDIVRHDSSLDFVARVNQEGDRVFLPDLLNTGVEPGHSVVVRLRAVLIGPSPDVAVHIGSPENDDVRTVFRQGCLAQQYGQQKGQNNQDAEYRSFHGMFPPLIRMGLICAAV